MQNILYKIYHLDEHELQYLPITGNCACCNQPVTVTEESLVNEFWFSFCNSPEPDVYLDLIVDCEQLSPNQFNAYHEPLLCIRCLKGALHRESSQQ